MKVLVVGSGGREHAICHAFSRSPRRIHLYAANGNAGIARIAECVPIKPDDVEGLAAFAERERIDLTFVGGETPLALGITDTFQGRGLRIIGPSRAAARLESSKSFAKDFMARHGVPTAKYVSAASPREALECLADGTFGDDSSPVVVKADGLAAGKGVVVARNRAEAERAVNEMSDLVGTTAGETIVIEECLVGREVSLLMFASGEQFALMPPTRDHKRIGEGDTGPNTGGMGAITDALLLSTAQIEDITVRFIKPTLKGCLSEGFPFQGVLFLGLMMTGDGPKLLEYNVRFGDPETQAILIRLRSDLIDVSDAILNASVADLDIEWSPGSSACVVLASDGYPASPRVGDPISGLDEAGAGENVEIFHSGTTFDPAGGYRTAGGRVFSVTAIASSLGTALETAYLAAGKIRFDGAQYRRDIGR